MPLRRTKVRPYVPRKPYSSTASSSAPSTPEMDEPLPSTSRSSGYPLQRGSACLNCRKRKMKCDGAKPQCHQCIKGNRAADCEYDDGKTKSRTQLLQEKINALEAKISELQGGQSTTPTKYPTLNASPQTFYDDPSFPSTSYDLYGSHQQLPSLISGPSSHSSPSSSHGVFGPGEAWEYENIDLQMGQFVHPPNQEPNQETWDIGAFTTQPDSLLDQWDKKEEVPQRVRDALLEVFLLHRRQCGMDFNVATFRASLTLPPEQQPHPALINTMCLLGCHLSRTQPMLQYERPLLKQSQQLLAESLETSDRLVNYIQASCLLAVFFFSKGRLLEGYHQVCSTARFAVGCELHKITSPIWTGDARPSSSRGSSRRRTDLLGLPANGVELGERILTFWQVFNLDRFWSVATGLPSALTEEEIETVWPRCTEDYETGAVFDEEYSTVRSLGLRQVAPLLRQDTTEALISKAIALFERSSRLSASVGPNNPPSDAFWAAFRIMDESISRLIATLPPVRSATDGSRHSPSAVDPRMILVHTLAHVSAIQLHNIFALDDTASASKSLASARCVTAVIREAPDVDISMLDAMLGPAWMVVADVLIRELIKRNNRGEVEIGKQLDMEIETVIMMMKQLAIIHPLAAFQTIKVEESKALAGSCDP